VAAGGFAAVTDCTLSFGPVSALSFPHPFRPSFQVRIQETAVSKTQPATAGRTLVAVIALAAASVEAQSFPTGIGPAGPVISGTTLGVPGSFGGVAFDPSGSTLYIAGNASSAGGAIYTMPVQRDAQSGRITGFGTPAFYASAPGNDGGLSLANGLVFFRTWPSNLLGETDGTTTITYPLPGTGSATGGGCAFIPAGIPGAGTLLVSGYGTGIIYSVPLTPAGNFFVPGTASVWADLSGVPAPLGGVGFNYLEGMEFIPAGPRTGDLAIASYSPGVLLVLDVDPVTGQPVGGAQSPSVSIISPDFWSAMGISFDPITGEAAATVYSLSALHRIGGFTSFAALTSSAAALSTGAGGTVYLDLRAGTANGMRNYILAGSLSGTTPGTPLGSVVAPLNIDSFTLFVLESANTPLFTNFIGTTNASGVATATINLPPVGAIPASVPIDWAYVLLAPENFASNPVSILLTP
jgi:hypothetical protein